MPTPHFQVKVKLKFFKLDSWNIEDMFILLNGNKILIGSFTCCDYGTDFCGSKIPPSNPPANYAYNDAVIKYEHIWNNA